MLNYRSIDSNDHLIEKRVHWWQLNRDIFNVIFCTCIPHDLRGLLAQIAIYKYSYERNMSLVIKIAEH